MRIQSNTLVMLIAEAFLGIYILLPWGEQTLRSVALGALAGIVGGHLNGVASRKKAS